MRTRIRSTLRPGRPTAEGGSIMHQPMRRLAAVLTLLTCGVTLAQNPVPLAQGSVIPREVFVSDAQGGQVALRSLLEAQPGNINVVFIFGGGDMGAKMPGRLWCQDSFEDTHILRTLVGKYQGKPVGFVAIASAPVYHSGALGAKNRVFLDAAEDSDDFRQARS